MTSRDCHQAMATLESWLQRLRGVKARLNQLPELHSKMDHYIDKVATMEKEKKERAAKKTPETPIQGEALLRNHEKLKAARKDYHFARDIACDAMDAEVTIAHNELDRVFVSVLQHQQAFLAEAGKLAPRFDEPIKGMQALVDKPPKREAVGMPKADASAGGEAAAAGLPGT